MYTYHDPIPWTRLTEESIRWSSGRISIIVFKAVSECDLIVKLVEEK